MRDLRNDKIHTTILAVVIYSIVLIFVICGSYVATKKIFSRYDEKVRIMKQQSEIEEKLKAEKEEIERKNKEEEEKQKAKEKIKTKIKKNEEIAKEVVINSHDIDPKLFIDTEKRTVDYSQQFFEAAKRDKDLKWVDDVFTRIENPDDETDTPVNLFDYKRICAKTSEGSDIRYDVFTNPDSKNIEKIRSVINIGSGFEILDMYYDRGNINYIAQYYDSVEKFEDMTSTKIESRYYFRDDTLVKYIYCEGENATLFDVAKVDSFSEGTKDQYDTLEQDMINMAYITLTAVNTLEERVKIEGYLLDEYNMPLSGIEVDLLREGSDEPVMETASDGDGRYTFETTPDDEALYCINIEKEGIKASKICSIAIPHGSMIVNPETAYLSYSDNNAVYNMQILVRDAEDDTKPLGGATITLRNGINNKKTDVIATGMLNEAGAVIVPMLAGCYTAQVSKDGYEDSYFTVVVKQDHNGVLGYSVKELGEGDYMAVLDWEATPIDLDIRAISEDAKQSVRSNVDSLGSVAESIRMNEAVINDYRIFVSDYGNCIGKDYRAYTMSNSSANVHVYSSEGEVSYLHVPASHSGVIWECARIRNNIVIPVNDYYYDIEDAEYFVEK